MIIRLEHGRGEGPVSVPFRRQPGGQARPRHVDPRSARAWPLADVCAPIQARSDIAFTGSGLSYVLENNAEDLEYALRSANVATIIGRRGSEHRRTGRSIRWNEQQADYGADFMAVSTPPMKDFHSPSVVRSQANVVFGRLSRTQDSPSPGDRHCRTYQLRLSNE